MNHCFIHNSSAKNQSMKNISIYELKLFPTNFISCKKKKNYPINLVWKIYLLQGCAVILRFFQSLNVTTCTIQEPREVAWINLSHPSHDLPVKHTALCDVYWLTQCVTPSSYWCLPVARYWCQFPLEIYRTENINFMKDSCSNVTCTISTTSVRWNQS